MAPRRKSIGSLRNSFNTVLDKENNYLRSLTDYQARVRRRESIRNYKNVAEYDLEQKIELETKIKEGSSKLLAAARHPAQSLEAARALFTSSKRMSAYTAELQHRKLDPASLKTNTDEGNGHLSISDLRFPLMWRDSDHFKNRGDYRRFAIFCIVRVGTEVHDTSLLYPIDREQTDISFPDILLFNEVPAEFELTLEVYSHILQEDLSIASTPRRIRRSIHSSISKTVGRKFAASLRDEYESNKVPQFELVAYAKMTLDDTHDSIRSHDLALNSFENKAHVLPLFGHFCCRLAVKPRYFDEKVCAGLAVINSQPCWAQLQAFQIQTWKSKKHFNKLAEPMYVIRVDKETVVRRSKSKNQLRVSNRVNDDDKYDVIELSSNEDVEKWFEQLMMCVKEHTRWKHAAMSLQEIPYSENSTGNVNTKSSLDGKSKRLGSLYDETPLTEPVFPTSISKIIVPKEQTEFASKYHDNASTTLSSYTSTVSSVSLISHSQSTLHKTHHR